MRPNRRQGPPTPVDAASAVDPRVALATIHERPSLVLPDVTEIASGGSLLPEPAAGAYCGGPSMSARERTGGSTPTSAAGSFRSAIETTQRWEVFPVALGTVFYGLTLWLWGSGKPWLGLMATLLAVCVGLFIAAEVNVWLIRRDERLDHRWREEAMGTRIARRLAWQQQQMAADLACKAAVERACAA